jgi:hypothetical protein
MLEHCRFGSETVRDKNGNTALMIALQSQLAMGILELLARFQRRSFLIADSMLLTCNIKGNFHCTLPAVNQRTVTLATWPRRLFVYS